jgi:hypothetical protein
MADNYEAMSDADLDALIYDNPSEHEDGGEPNLGEESKTPVSPTSEDSDEQTDEPEVDNDDGQSTDEDDDSEDDSTDEDQTDDSDQDTDDEEDEASDTDTNDDEDKGTEADDDKSKTTEKFQPLRANGKEYPVDSIDELYKLASAGVGAQQKFQAIAGHKKSIMAAEKAGVDIMEAVNFMANYKEDPKGTMLNLLKQNNIDPLDIDMDAEGAKTKDYSVSDFEVSYDEVVGEIGNSPKFKDVQDVLLSRWDKTSRDIFLDKPSMIKNLHDEMMPIPGQDKSMWDLVSPLAEKMKMMGDSRSDYEVYMDARQKKVEEFQKHQETVQKAKPTPQKSKAEVNAKKKAASPSKGKSTGNKTVDLASLSDDELDAFIAKLG